MVYLLNWSLDQFLYLLSAFLGIKTFGDYTPIALIFFLEWIRYIVVRLESGRLLGFPTDIKIREHYSFFLK